MREEKGSITIFSLLSLLLITATIFSLLEGTRLQEMKRFAMLQTELAMESAFANYNSCLWKEYRLLASDEDSMKIILEKTSNGRAGTGVNLLRLVPKEIRMDEYARMTDGNGSVFITSVASYMKENFVYEVVKEIYSQYEAMKQILDSNQMERSNIEDALTEVESIEISKRARGGKEALDVKGILETAKRWQEVGILELVLPNTETLSTSRQDFSGGLLERALKKEKNSMQTTNGWTERMLLQQYLLTYMSSFTEKKENRVLSYELEYLIGQQSSDVENLKLTVAKLLAIREASNFLYLMSDSARVTQVEALATLLIGATANPVLIEVVKIGVLTAWALAESILDVRALLQGKRIALLKSEETWTIELENLSQLSQEFLVAKECQWGLDYESYLGILLLFENEQNLAMRTMHVQEASIRKMTKDVGFCMDSLITHAKAHIAYSYKPVFPFLQTINAQKRWEYVVGGEAEYGYY